MTPLHIKRLRRLAEHLNRGKLGHKIFDFNSFNYDNRDPENLVSPRKCGTHGCAVGECPVVWPRLWKFDVAGMPVLREGNHFSTPQESAVWFFGITNTEFAHLFLPFGQRPTVCGGRRLGRHPTRKAVAANILAFIKCKESEGIPDFAGYGAH